MNKVKDKILDSLLKIALNKRYSNGPRLNSNDMFWYYQGLTDGYAEANKNK